jgi:hypothetical protein
LGCHQDVKLLGKPTADVNPGANGDVSIWRNGADTGYVVSGVKLDWTEGGEKISSGKEVFIIWLAYEKLWRFTGAECE